MNAWKLFTHSYNHMLCALVRMCVCVSSAYISTHMYVCMYVCMNVLMYVLRYVCMCVCMYACVYVCMHMFAIIDTGMYEWFCVVEMNPPFLLFIQINVFFIYTYANTLHVYNHFKRSSLSLIMHVTILQFLQVKQQKEQSWRSWMTLRIKPVFCLIISQNLRQRM